MGGVEHLKFQPNRKSYIKRTFVHVKLVGRLGSLRNQCVVPRLCQPGHSLNLNWDSSPRGPSPSPKEAIHWFGTAYSEGDQPMAIHPNNQSKWPYLAYIRRIIPHFTTITIFWDSFLVFRISSSHVQMPQCATECSSKREAIEQEHFFFFF